MERHVERFLKRISYISITLSTLIITLIILSAPQTCKQNQHLPRTSCQTPSRQIVSTQKRNNRTWSTKSWSQSLTSHSLFFTPLLSERILTNHSKSLVLFAGPGQPVMALTCLGIMDVTGVEVIDSPPLVKRADPHNLPFFDSTFDFAFTSYFEAALFPARFASEMERAVRAGGACVLALESCGGEDLEEILEFFTRSEVAGVKNVTLAGKSVTRVVLMVNKKSSLH